MVESVDDCMRDMLSELKKHGIDENTLIIFTSDNGGLDRNGKPTDNAPCAVERILLRGRHPRAFPRPLAKPKYQQARLRLSGFLDRICFHDHGSNRYDLPKDRPIDGLSLGKHLESGGKKSPNRETLHLAFPSLPSCPGPPIPLSAETVISNSSKFWEGIYELYDLDKDLGEKTKNMAETMPDKV